MTSVDIQGSEFRRMQLIQIDMLAELDRVCRKHNINYVITAGTLIGAIRHKGYIPWDDDADVAMLREDYERFKSVAMELNADICYFQDHDTDKEYLWGYGKLRRTGTSFVRVGQEHLKNKTGVFVDIFPMDDIPIAVWAQKIHCAVCFCLRKMLWAQVAKKSARGLWKVWYNSIALIKPDFVFLLLNRLQKGCNASSNRVRNLAFPAFGMLYMKNEHPATLRYGLPKKWLLERAEYDFEGLKLFGTKDYDGFLSYMYGDYMALPPENKRTPHAPVSSYDFGEIRK